MNPQVLDLINLNAKAVFVLGVLIWTYRYFWPRQKIAHPVLVFLIALLPTISFWRTGVFESGDFALHTKILSVFNQSLEQGIWWPRWAAHFCGGLGYPHFRYFYKLPYYLGSAYHSLGLSVIDSTKLVFVSSYLAAGLSSYGWLRKWFDKNSALMGSLFYLFTPYHLMALHFRHAMGENLSLALAPLALISLHHLSQKKWWMVLVITFSTIILSHHIAPLLLLPLLVGYSLVIPAVNKKKNLILTLAGLITSFLLTAFHWLPILMESNLLNQSQMLVVKFHTSWEFLASPWKGGLLFQGPSGQTGTSLGVLQILIVLASIWLVLKQKTKWSQKWPVVFFTAIFWGSAIFMQSIFKPVWEALPLVNNFQFSTRFLFLTTLSSAWLGSYVINYFQKKSKLSVLMKQMVLFLLGLLLVGSTFLNWGNRGLIPDITDNITWFQIPERCDVVALPKGVKQESINYLTANSLNVPKIIDGQAQLRLLSKSNENRNYEVKVASETATIRDSILYFPGWRVIENGQDVVMLEGQQLITFQLPKGIHKINIVYSLTQWEALGLFISQITVLGLLVWGMVWQVSLFREGWGK